jgi:hypothetical protein
MAQEADPVAARELRLFMENDYEIYRREGYFILNLVRKKRKGKYDPWKAPNLYLYLVDEGAQKYATEFGNGGGTGIGGFNKPTRLLVAREYVETFEENYVKGEYADLDVRPGAPNPHDPSSHKQGGV